MKRSRLGEVLLSEGLRWRKEETWFGERVDPDLRRKGGDRRLPPAGGGLVVCVDETGLNRPRVSLARASSTCPSARPNGRQEMIPAAAAKATSSARSSRNREALTWRAERRTTTNFVAFLEQFEPGSIPW